MKLKLNLTKAKEKFFKPYIHIRNTWSKGYGEIYQPINIIQNVIILIAGIKILFGIMPPVWIIVIIGINALFIPYGIGEFWNRAHIYDYEADWRNERNPLMRALEDKLKK